MFFFEAESWAILLNVTVPLGCKGQEVESKKSVHCTWDITGHLSEWSKVQRQGPAKNISSPPECHFSVMY